MSRSLALILGVGAVDGIGGALCLRAAAAGHHVIAAGRTAEKLDHLVAAVEAAGGSAEGHVVDLADSDRIGDLFAAVDGRDGRLDFTAYNAGNSFRHTTADMPAAFFEEAWRICCLGGFIAGQAAANRMATTGGGTLLFTGATASVKARPPFIAFAAAKAALRGNRLPKDQDSADENDLLSPAAIAEAYWQLHLQHPSAWSFEIDLRPFNEVF